LAVQTSRKNENRGPSQLINVHTLRLSEETVIDKLSKIKYSNTTALILIINSYGGSLRVAKNISHSLDLLRKKE